MFINRDYRRTEEDDFKINVLSRMGLDSEAIPAYQPRLLGIKYSDPPSIAGWTIQPKGE